MIDFVTPVTEKELFLKGGNLLNESGDEFPVINGIPRFIEIKNYADAFGLQWKTFAKTQLDSYSGTDLTKDRLERCLGFSIEKLEGKNILEVGCGAGRFTELFIKGKGNVHSVDLSTAVEANKENIGEKENYVVAQASVYELPFPKCSFDVVVCLGVIQHTPSPEKTINSLWEMVKPGGLLVIDHYKWRLAFYTTPGPYFRFFLKGLKPSVSQKIINFLGNIYFPLHWNFRNNKKMMWIIRHLSPVLENIKEFEAKGKKFNLELAKLETYDHLTDFYKHLRTPEQIKKTLSELENSNDYWVTIGGNGVEARCKKQINGK